MPDPIMSRTRAHISAALISEGRCWDDRTPLIPKPDGFADCTICGRRMRITAGVVQERFPWDEQHRGRICDGISADCLGVNTDGTTFELARWDDGTTFVPGFVEWLQVEWAIPT